ncbi:MAG: hypothetical protein HOV80_33005 [Polyangiaceae bacterium]|nr:hypothetical protein [Polyangiaceae bacterium]
MHPKRRLAFGVTTGLTIALFAAIDAAASDFTPEGEHLFDPEAVFTYDFEEDFFPEGEAEGGGGGGPPSLTVEDEGALSKARVLRLGQFEGVDVPVTVAEGAQAYRVSAWIRGGETIADVEVRYDDNPHPGVDEIAVLYPTGRMTSDGWVEVSAYDVRVDANRGAKVSVGFFSATGSDVDALEIVRERSLGPEDLSGQACKGSSDPVCGTGQVCVASQCRYVGAWVPPIPVDRDDVAAYLAARMELLFGPLRNREVDLPIALVTLDRMRDAQDPWTYWNAFLLGVRRLHDGHTTTSGIADFVLENEKPLGMCFLEGDADLSHGRAPKDPLYLDILVSHVASSRNLGLKAGDRLVYVDGEHPIAWARAQVEHHWSMSPTSNHETYAEIAEQLRGLVARYAHTITVVRCDPVTSTCGELETIDISAVPTITPDEVFESVACDNRPLRHLSSAPANHQTGGNVYHGIVNESDAVERIYGAEWESLSVSGNGGVGPLIDQAIAAFKADARGVILDHRSGNGGTILGPQKFWSFAVPSHPVSFYLHRQRAEDEAIDQTAGLALFEAGQAEGLVDWGGGGTGTTMPVALLLTRDVSASDWLPLGLKGQLPNVRIFAPFQTNGGFSTRYGFGYWLGMSYVMAVGETFDATGRSLGGHGVEPDQIVLPKQSDLLAGRDTLFDVAIGWVRGGLQ